MYTVVNFKTISILKKSIPKTVNNSKDGSKILVVEDGGRPIHIGLKVRDAMGPKVVFFGGHIWIQIVKFGVL